jgi:hypothetical protein
MPIGAGYTFVCEHLWIVVSDQNSDGEVLVVNVTSLRDSSDDTCILDPGEHPFIDHQSVINFRKAQVWRAQRIESAAANGAINPQQVCSTALLKRIREAALKSPFFTIKLRKYL